MFHPQKSHIESSAKANNYKMASETRYGILIIYNYINSLGSKIIIPNLNLSGLIIINNKQIYIAPQ